MIIMALNAKRAGATPNVPNIGGAAVTPEVLPPQAGPVAPQVNVTPQAVAPQPQVQAAPQPAVQPQVAPAVVNAQTAPANVVPGGLVDLNKELFDNIDGLDQIGSYVQMDGESFVYKGTNPERRVRQITCFVGGGKRYYQYVDETDPANKQYHSSDYRIDDRYKMKFDLRWSELVDKETGESKEWTFSMPTSTAWNFVNFLRDLAKLGHSVGGVLLRMTISRQTQQGTTNKYSRAEFEAYTQDGQTLLLKTAEAGANLAQ